jgi:hypothetical protein
MEMIESVKGIAGFGQKVSWWLRNLTDQGATRYSWNEGSDALDGHCFT